MSCSKESGSQKSFENLMSTFQSGNEDQIIKISERNFSDNPFNQYLFEDAPFYLKSFKKIKYKIIEVKEDNKKNIEEIINVSDYLYKNKLVAGKAGNVSARFKGEDGDVEALSKEEEEELTI